MREALKNIKMSEKAEILRYSHSHNVLAATGLICSCTTSCKHLIFRHWRHSTRQFVEKHLNLPPKNLSTVRGSLPGRLSTRYLVSTQQLVDIFHFKIEPNYDISRYVVTIALIWGQAIRTLPLPQLEGATRLGATTSQQFYQICFLRLPKPGFEPMIFWF